MFLKQLSTNELVEVLDTVALFDPSVMRVRGQRHCGEEMPDPEVFTKRDLAFPSDEPLPRCWRDPHYRA